MAFTVTAESKKKFKQKAIGLLGANAFIWALTFTLYKMPSSFGVMFSAFTLPYLVYFALSDFGAVRSESGGLSFSKALGYYFGVSGAAMIVALWGAASVLKFPPMFIVTMIVFALLGLFLFIFLEFKPDMAEPSGLKSVNNLLVLYVGSSALYLFTSTMLPQYEPENEIAKLKQTTLSLAGADKDTVIRAGAQVFKDFECFNCHNIAPGGEVKRGPNLSEIDLGKPEKITESLVDPYKEILKPYAENPKVARSMPDYYGKQLTKDELVAVVTYLENLKSALHVSTENMPEGWWTNAAVVEEGRKLYEGLVNPDVACHVCHGKDGKPLFEGAPDFTTSPDMENLTEARWFQIIKYGFGKDSPMSAWGEMLSDEQIWKITAYEWAFYSKGKLGNAELVERSKPEGPAAIQAKDKYWD
ncbi:MAG: c-type cytochrome [Nitrospinae bacterium]|nr:c-type cytochrome [Nitrospinota bacterium]